MAWGAQVGEQRLIFLVKGHLLLGAGSAPQAGGQAVQLLGGSGVVRPGVRHFRKFHVGTSFLSSPPAGAGDVACSSSPGGRGSPFRNSHAVEHDGLRGPGHVLGRGGHALLHPPAQQLHVAAAGKGVEVFQPLGRGLGGTAGNRPAGSSPGPMFSRRRAKSLSPNSPSVTVH